jgi:hypothetical protein
MLRAPPWQEEFEFAVPPDAVLRPLSAMQTRPIQSKVRVACRVHPHARAIKLCTCTQARLNRQPGSEDAVSSLRVNLDFERWILVTQSKL